VAVIVRLEVEVKGRVRKGIVEGTDFLGVEEVRRRRKRRKRRSRGDDMVGGRRG